MLLVAAAAVAGDARKPEKPPVAVTTRAETNIVDKALSWLGINYRFAGNDEKKGFDCAGLVKRVFGDSGVKLPRTAADQFREGLAIAFEDLRPGDLVFFQNTYKRGISHVGIYIGERLFVHAASTRRSVVVDRIDMPYYLTRFAGGRRVTAAAAQPPVAPVPVAPKPAIPTADASR
jgi:cell wall-associated NlpC family hydrolase